MSGDAVIRTSGLTKHYGRTVALRDVDLEVRRGEVFGFLGPNGAGKTTTLRILMGLLRPTAGKAEVLGEDPWRGAVALHRRVGYVSGETALYDRLTGRQHVELLTHLRGSAGQARDLAGRLGVELDRRTRELSKGNRQKLAILLGLMSGPELLVLDEPTSGLDPLAQNTFHDLLRQHVAAGGSVLLSSHVLGEVEEVADRVGVLRAGELIAVESLAEMRAKALHHVRVTFDHSVPAAALTSVPGVHDVAAEGARLTCSAPQIALDGLLKTVARYGVVDFECAEAGLEETFLAYYGAARDDRQGGPASPRREGAGRAA
ncbi:ABC-2 type transport system ATP-binding protein [Georgenia soli]|uniref:ABC-2 type transport system ATP-binding protein n=1 Tax=Georgenia soli TaxID=638953 RepID=A0A2A9EPP1_9MICO|nr:ABC transporter ATP-binding protein [Georgenia soli]PFG40179.1 ABC-2 type transport system ATP-binding protein [Georgenia soli]